MFLISEIAKYIVVFIVLEFVSLFPIILWLIESKNFAKSDIRLKRITTWAMRSIFCVILCAILFIFLPNFRVKLLFLTAILIVFNALLFKTKLL